MDSSFCGGCFADYGDLRHKREGRNWDEGKKIDFRRNPFEYVSITKAIDCAYKGAMYATKNEMRKMLFKFGPLEGGDELLDNLNFTTKEGNKDE